jgi:hypothetical protein
MLGGKSALGKQVIYRSALENIPEEFILRDIEDRFFFFG